MGIFDKLVGRENVPLTPQGGLLLAAISMIAIDGDIDDDEIAIIRRLDGSGKTDAWEAATRAWKMNSLEECISLASNSMSAEQQLTALANLVDIAMADGILAGSEKDLLEAYAAEFDVDTANIQSIVSVISIKNNKDIFHG